MWVANQLQAGRPFTPHANYFHNMRAAEGNVKPRLPPFLPFSLPPGGETEGTSVCSDVERILVPHSEETKRFAEARLAYTR